MPGVHAEVTAPGPSESVTPRQKTGPSRRLELTHEAKLAMRAPTWAAACPTRVEELHQAQAAQMIGQRDGEERTGCNPRQGAPPACVRCRPRTRPRAKR